MLTLKLRRRYLLLLCLLPCLLFQPKEALPADGTEESGVLLPVIMYHHVLEHGSFGEYVIPVSLLREDLAYLQEKGYQAVLMQDLIAYADGEGALPEKPVLLTFDDGYESNYRYAYPLLQEYGMKAVISVIGYWSELYTHEQYKHINYSHLTEAQLRELSDSGIVEIQNHSFHLHSLEGRKGTKKQEQESEEAYREILWNDLSKNQEYLQATTGVLPTTFTYPFGYVSQESLELVRQMGFRASLSCSEGMNRIQRNPDCLYLLKRFNRPYSCSSQAFFEQHNIR